MRAASNIIGMALAITVTLGLAGSVAYFLTQQTNVLTTQEGIGLTGPRLLKTDAADVLSLSIKNTGTSPLANPEITLTGACEAGSSPTDAKITTTTTTIKPGSTYGVSEQIKAGNCEGTSPSVNIAAGTSYVLSVKATASGTDSTIKETVTVTSRY